MIGGKKKQDNRKIALKMEEKATEAADYILEKIMFRTRAPSITRDAIIGVLLRYHLQAKQFEKEEKWPTT